MSTAAPQYPRHALGLPAGSIRALLAIGILCYLWLLLIVPTKDGTPVLERAPTSFVYLQVLMVLILAHFFSAHGKTIGSNVSRHSPLGLPRGSVRFLLLGGYLGLAVYAYQRHEKFQMPDTAPILLVLAVLITAFLCGNWITGMVTHWWGKVPAWFQDIQAWFALMGLFVLGIIFIIRFVINASMPFEKQLSPDIMEAILAGVVGFYFGARS
jgi:hypothetical protein